MKSSDSESESFQSAEEDFDESEEENTKSSFNKTVSESKVATPVVDKPSSSENQSKENDGLKSSTKFRKKPKSLNQLTNIPPVKFQFGSKKSPTSESIFKTEKIAPDAFFQDITRNLSENINKSLSTLQQTSSNVKDLILGSLPVTTIDDKESFSYDDNDECSNSVSDSEVIDSKSSKTEITENVPSDIIKVQEKGKQNENSELENREKKKPNHGHLNKINNELLEESVSSHSKEKNGKEYASVENNFVICERSGYENKNNNTSENLFDSETKQSLNLKQDDSKIEKDITEPQEQLPNIDQELNKEVVMIESAKISDEITNKTHTPQKIGGQLFSLSASKGEVSSVANISSIDDKEDIDEIHTVRNDSDLELRKISSKEMTFESHENNIEDEKLSLMVSSQSVEVSETGGGDGWDDFDFSDNELESFEGSKTVNKNVIESDLNKGLEKLGLEIKNLKTEKQNTHENLTVKDENHSKTESTEIREEKGFEQNTMPNSNKVSETREATDDDWGWDSWEDESSVDKQKLKESENNTLKHEKIDNERNDFFDEKRWSGWDTFGQKQEEKQANWNIGSWGVNMLLNKATAVTQGLSNVLEAGLGAPDPETLARMELAERQKMKEAGEAGKENSPTEVSKKNSLSDVNIFPSFGITNLVAEVTSKIVEHSKIQEIGSKVITGGLDTLETFGKKTMEVLQEGDPGLKNKRALLLSSNKPVLSQVLKEAREKADKELRKSEEKEMFKKCHFETVFDDFQGMVNLEALEMLSRQCEIKLEQIRSQMNAEEQEDLDGILEEVEQLCSLDDYEISPSSMVDFKTSLKMAVEPLKDEINLQRIIKIHEEAEKWFQFIITNQPNANFIQQKVVATLAELTAATVHQFHKAGELLSVKECRKTVEEVEALSKMTGALCSEIKKLGQKFIQISKDTLGNQIGSEDINSLVEKVNVVVKNSTSYITQAFNLLIPVLQIGAAV